MSSSNVELRHKDGLFSSSGLEVAVQASGSVALVTAAFVDTQGVVLFAATEVGLFNTDEAMLEGLGTLPGLAYTKLIKSLNDVGITVVESVENEEDADGTGSDED